jgi:hypothetical protein
LDDQADRFGLAVANFSYSQCDNDKKLTAAARQTMDTILRAAGRARSSPSSVTPTWSVDAAWPETRPRGLVDGDLRSFGVPNLRHKDGDPVTPDGYGMILRSVDADRYRVA